MCIQKLSHVFKRSWSETATHARARSRRYNGSLWYFFTVENHLLIYLIFSSAHGPDLLTWHNLKFQHAGKPENHTENISKKCYNTRISRWTANAPFTTRLREISYLQTWMSGTSHRRCRQGTDRRVIMEGRVVYESMYHIDWVGDALCECTYRRERNLYCSRYRLLIQDKIGVEMLDETTCEKHNETYISSTSVQCVFILPKGKKTKNKNICFTAFLIFVFYDTSVKYTSVCQL
jgi:hypothetical protein